MHIIIVKIRVHNPNHTMEKRKERDVTSSLVARLLFSRRNIPKAFTVILNLLSCFVFIAAPFPNTSKMWLLGNVITFYAV